MFDFRDLNMKQQYGKLIFECLLLGKHDILFI